ncbi:MAG: hypothetical protein WA672_10005 [Candidatus Angelobacter sp.]
MSDKKAGKRTGAMANGTANGKPMTTNEQQDHQRMEVEEHEATQQRANELAVKLARTYEELTRLLERNPAMKRDITQGTTKEDKVYQKLKQRLKMADMAPRCRWVKQDGTSCRSPQMKQHIYCFAHMQMAEARTLLLLLPPPEDANAIQVGLMKIQKAMIEDTISTKKAGLLLYSMQLALTNVGQTTFGKAKDEEMVRDTVGEEDAISEEARSNQHPVFSEEQHPPRRHGGTEESRGLPENQRPFTAKDAEQDKALPRTDADERGLNNGAKQIEWRPTPDMYRTDTPEGREAYEACLRRTMSPPLDAERRPPQPVMGSEDGAQTHAVLG